MIYQINIALLNKGHLSFTSQMPYFGNSRGTDKVTFREQEISIVAERSSRIGDSDLFMNVQNSLYNQMLKCLQIHYCFEGARAGISRIDVAVYRHLNGRANPNAAQNVGSNGLIARFFRVFDKFQPYTPFDAPTKFTETAIRQLLLEDDDSYALRIIISHWLSQGWMTDRQRRLECVWRTFERICEHLRHVPKGRRSNISEGLDLVVEELIRHPERYPQTRNLVSGETLHSLRELRWREMIENNYPNRTSNYSLYEKRFCTPYSDARVCNLMKQLLVYRKTELQYAGLYNAIVSRLSNQITRNQTNDIDVAALLCYYAYYLRNRLFHGQSLVRGSVFDEHKTDEMRIDFLTLLLSTLTVELINQYQLL